MAILTGVKNNSEVGTLVRVPFSGGTPREILEQVVAADWGPDGESLAVARIVDHHNRIEYPIGKILVERKLGQRPRSAFRQRATVLPISIRHEVGDYALSLVGTACHGKYSRADGGERRL